MSREVQLTGRRPGDRRTVSLYATPPKKHIPKQGIVFAIIAVLFLVVAPVTFGHHLAKHSTNAPAANHAESDGDSSADDTADATLDQIISNWQQSQGLTATVEVHEVTGSMRTSSYDPTKSMPTASTFKVYVAYAILHGIERGNYSLSTVTDDGNTIETDLDNMILNSDNDASRTLGFMYGWQNIDTLLHSQGMSSTNLNNYTPPSTNPVGDKFSTADDLADILEKLYQGKLLNQAHTQLLIGLMEQQNYRTAIPAGVPSGATVADKPGWISPADGENEYIENDAAIVYGPKSTYVLVINTNSSSTKPLTNLSKLVYNYLEA